MKAMAHRDICVCICDTDVWGPRVCPLLEQPVCYFYCCYKLLTVSVMTAQVSLMLSSLLTRSISLFTDMTIMFCPDLLNSGLF